MGNKDEFLGYDDDRYHLANLSCRFLSYINPDFVRPVYVQNLEQALDEVRRGKHWGVLEFHSKYSDSLYDRFFNHIAVVSTSIKSYENISKKRWPNLLNPSECKLDPLALS